MKNIKFLSSENGVSEVLDFVTILGILVLSIGVIGIAGYPMLEKAKAAKHIDNTEQSFIVMGENINKVVMGQAPSQSVEMKMYGEMFSVIPDSRRVSKINVTLTNSSGFTDPFEWPLGAVEAEFDTATIAYENTGAWIRYNSGGVIMISSPNFVLEGDSVIIPVTSITGSSSIAGEGLMRVVANGITDDIYYRQDIKKIRIRVTGIYSEGWQKKFLNETKGWTESAGSMEKNFSPPVNVYFLRKTINVEMQS